MSFKGWKEYKLVDAIQFNPRETIKKGDKVKKIPMEKLEPYTRKITGFEETEFTSGTKFRNGDTLLARITPCLENGKTAQVDILNKNEVAFGSTEFIVLREKLGITDNDFIYYLSISPEFRNLAIKSMNGSSGRQRVPKDVLEQCQIKLPSLEEQRVIASILSSFDKKIEINNQINKKLEEMAQVIFKQWFIDFEFPNEDGKPYKSSGGEMVESELGLIPNEWGVKSLNEVVHIKYGKNLPTKNLISLGYPVFGGNGIIGCFSEYMYKEPQVIIACRGAASGKVLTTLPYSFITNNSLVLENDSKIVSHEYLKEHCLKNQFFEYTTGSAQPQITITNLATAKIVVPINAVLEKYSRIIKSIEDKKLTIDFENKNLYSIRDTLLPKLISGQIRVSLESNEN